MLIDHKSYPGRERFACRVLGQPRTTQRKAPRTADDETALTLDIIKLGSLKCGGMVSNMGYRRNVSTKDGLQRID